MRAARQGGRDLGRVVGVVVVHHRARPGLTQSLETSPGAPEAGEALDRATRVGAGEPRGLERDRRVQRIVRSRHTQLDLMPAPLET